MNMHSRHGNEDAPIWAERRLPLPEEAFRTVRNKLRKYPAEQIVVECVKRLHPDPKVDVAHFPPWLLLLLIKWTIMYGVSVPKKRRNLSPHDFSLLTNHMHDFDGAVGLQELAPEHISRYMRRLALQQFSLLQPYGLAGIARQYEFFGTLPRDHAFAVTFRDLTGVDTSDFCELALCLMARCIHGEAQITRASYFENIADAYDDGVIPAFLRTISQDWAGIKRHLDEDARSRALIYELYERSPLWDYPLLSVADAYVCYSPVLLYDRLQYCIYRVLRDHNPGWFMGRFGSLFCRYVGLGVDALDLLSFSEAEIQNAIGSDSKAVDFLVVDGGANILIEVKGVEVPEWARLSLDPERVRQRLKPSIIAGLRQGYSMLRTLAGRGQQGDPLGAQAENYLLIVTYEQMYLGNGASVDEVLDLSASHPTLADSQLMPLENVYVVSVDEFDLLVSALAGSERNLADVLRQAVACDRDSATRKLTFTQHLMSQFGPLDLPSHLKASSDQLVESLKRRFPAYRDR